MQVCEQVVDVLRVEGLAVAGHLVTTETNDVTYALVIRGQAAQRKVFILEDALQPRPFLAASRVRLVAAVTVRVINLATGGLLRIEAKLRVRLAPLYVASEEH